jgi:predicted phosphodiesterase
MLSFLQLSDIHFRGGPDRGDGDDDALDYELRERLIQDTRSAIAEIGGVSGVVVCGDLANSGSGSEFTQASTWLQSLCSAIGVPPWMVWVVPGNHDLDRARIGEAQLELRDRLRQADDALAVIFAEVLADPDEREKLLEPLYNYLEFASAYGCGLDPGLHWSEHFDLPAAGLELRGLTSAILCGKGDNTGANRTVIGDEQAQFPPKPSTLYYTLCHHPRCWLLDRDEIESWFHERVHIRVTGHLHVRTVTPTPPGIHLRAGAVSPPRGETGSYVEPMVPRYELVSIDAVEYDGRPHVDIVIRGRRWSQSDDAWIADLGQNGVVSRRYEIGIADSQSDIPLPPVAPAATPEFPERELRYRLAQLQPYDRGECARAIDAPLNDVTQAPAHRQVALIFDWAKANGSLTKLHDAVTAAVHDLQPSDNPSSEHNG